MNKNHFFSWLLLAGALALFACMGGAPARAAEGCRHHLGVSAGVVHMENPSETDFGIGAEYECRLDAFLGLGGFFNYIFASPGIGIVGAPELFVHPLGGDFYVATSPILELGSGVGTHLGLRLATRVPIPLALFMLVPSFAIDFINGGKIYWFGLGVRL